MKQSLLFSKQDREDLLYMISKATNGIAREMDLTDKREYRYYKRQLELSGITPKLFPQTHKVIEMAARNVGLADMNATADNGTPVNVVAEIASRDNGVNYETTVLSSIPGGTHDTTITARLHDENMNPIGPISVKKDSGGGKGLYVNATGSFTSPIPPGGRRLYAVATIQYTNAEGTHKLNVFSTTVNFPKEINNTDPRDINLDGKIKVCLTRSDNDCDYRHDQHDIVRIPVKGNIVYFGNIDVDANNRPVNATNVLEVARTDEGGSPLTPPPGFNFFTDPKTIVSGAVLSWDLGWVNFDKPNFNSGDNVYYIFSVVLQVGGQSVTAFITNAPSSVVPGQTEMNTLQIPPMVVVYGCLAAKTKILMADGSTKPISKVNAGDRIISNMQGGVLTVVDTVEGTEAKPMIRITCQNGNSTLLTDGHPIVTMKGIKLARQLKVGDRLPTRDKSTNITELTWENYTGIVYNLNVGNKTDKVKLGADNTTFIADGIMVGDGHMQSYYGDLVKSLKKEVLKRIPEEWHIDYLNSKKLKIQ